MLSQSAVRNGMISHFLAVCAREAINVSEPQLSQLQRGSDHSRSFLKWEDEGGQAWCL